MYKNEDGDYVAPEALLPAEVRELLEVAESHSERKELTVKLLLETGMRAGELAHIRPSWFFRRGGSHGIKIPRHDDCGDPCCTDCASRAEDALRSWCRNGPTEEEVAADPALTRDDLRPEVGSDAYHELLRQRKEAMWKPKSENGAREIPVDDPGLWERCREHAEEHDGWSCGRSGLWYRVRALRDDMDLDKPLSPHILRHTYCQGQARGGMKPENLMAAAGHSDISSTQRYYDPDFEQDVAPDSARAKKGRGW
jgi:integrase